MKHNELLVYDENGQFRPLDTSNYNDDIIIGTIFFDRNVIEVIKQFCLIVGYVLIEKNSGYYYPIDIHDGVVVMFEGTYNCLPEQLKKKMIKYNLHKANSPCWSYFFFQWQFQLSEDCFKEGGPMIELCSECLGKEEIMKSLIKNECHIFEPSNFTEMSTLTKNLFGIFKLDINAMDYEMDYKYLVDSVLNGYYIRFDKKDIEKFFFNVCVFCIKKIRGEL